LQSQARNAGQTHRKNKKMIVCFAPKAIFSVLRTGFGICIDGVSDADTDLMTETAGVK
jgi:hypothetical protein